MKAADATMPELAIVPVKNYEVEGNFDDVKKFLEGVRAKYRDLVFTEDNIETAKIIKAELVSLRTSLTKIQTDVKKQRFNDPKKIFDAKMDALLAITGEVEAEIDAALSREDQKRIDEINEALEAYKDHFVTVYSLEPQYAERVEFKKSFYNKTAIEKESKADIESQCKSLAAEQKARNGSIKLIKKALAGTPEINVDEQIRKLDNGHDVVSILEWIEGEQERLASLAMPKSVGVAGVPADSRDYANDGEEQEEDVPTLTGKVVDAAKKIDFSTDFPGKTKSLSVTITYPVDAGDALTELFKTLREYGITTKVNK
jgi:hypothetical protein